LEFSISSLSIDHGPINLGRPVIIMSVKNLGSSCGVDQSPATASGAIPGRNKVSPALMGRLSSVNPAGRSQVLYPIFGVLECLMPFKTLPRSKPLEEVEPRQDAFYALE
jgi:hypothetical protein